MLLSDRNYHRPVETPDTPNFIEVLFGLALKPNDILPLLMNRADPPYGLTIFVLLLLTLTVPLVAQLVKYELPGFNPMLAAALGLTVFGTCCVFIFLSAFLFKICGVEANWAQKFALFYYASFPFTLAIWLLYLINYVQFGNLTLVIYLVTGFGRPNDVLSVAPLVFCAAYVWSGVIIYFATREFGGHYAFMTNLASFCVWLLVPAALLAGLLLGRLLHREAGMTIFNIFL